MYVTTIEFLKRRNLPCTKVTPFPNIIMNVNRCSNFGNCDFLSQNKYMDNYVKKTYKLNIAFNLYSTIQNLLHH